MPNLLCSGFYVLNLSLRWTFATIFCFLIYGQTSSDLCVFLKFAFKMECLICFRFIINNFVEHMFVFHQGSTSAAVWSLHPCWTRRDVMCGLDIVEHISEVISFSSVAQYVGTFPDTLKSHSSLSISPS